MMKVSYRYVHCTITLSNIRLINCGGSRYLFERLLNDEYKVSGRYVSTGISLLEQIVILSHWFIDFESEGRVFSSKVFVRGDSVQHF